MKRFLKILKYSGLSLLGLILLLLVLVNLPAVQTYLAKKATAFLSKKLKTIVSIDKVKISLLNHVSLQGVYIQDQWQDTLLYAGEAQARISDWFIFKKQTPVLHYVGLHNAYAHLYRTNRSNTWNYQFIIDAFSGGPSTGKKQQLKLDLKKLDIRNVRFFMDDAWVGNDMDFTVGNLQLNADKVDFDKKIIALNKIACESVAIRMKDYKGGKPVDTSLKRKQAIIDTTAFNPDNWVVKLRKLTLDDCLFNLESSEVKPIPGEFDPTHLFITGIFANATDITIKGDTLHGDIKHLAANERCGLQLKEAKAKVTVSPNAAICEHFTLITANSKFKDAYYAMLYTRFPAFKDYIDSVAMDVRLKDAVVDEKDVAFFAPALKQYPTILHISGEAKGTVANINAQNMRITDGKSVVNGNIKMKGLPDIYNTRIDFDHGEIVTTGAGILKYAPSLKDNPNVAIDKLTYFYFNGAYSGYIENFAVNGIIKTNFGTIQSDIKMNLPGFSTDNAVYTGTIVTTNFDLGTLLRQPDLGAITLRAGVSGMSFDPDRAQINTNANISSFSYRGYTYRNISAEGILAKKHFDGKLLVNDSNLALAFYGSLDFNQKMAIVNAKANLLKSDFHALHLTKDTIQAVADLDLNCTGSTVDDFLGYIKLYNIDIKRNQQRLNVDSVYVNSSAADSNRKQLTIQSNDIAATITGNYQLTKLPYSVQYYLSKYIPNYIKEPAKVAPEQNLTFEVQTKNVDTLLYVTTSLIHGFNNSSIKGSLNTFDKQLGLKIVSPYVAIDKYSLYDLNVTGNGNFNQLALNTEVQNVVIGDSMLNGSLSLTTAVGNDSVNFTLATTAPEANTSATIAGQIIANGDSLYLSLSPSEFFLNKTKWDIPAGNYVVYSKDYLLIRNLELESGLQKINITTQKEGPEQAMAFNVTDLDLGQLGALGGMAEYQPEGRINGDIIIDKLFKEVYISANIKATNVKFGGDTLGNINIVGSYDGKKKLVMLDPKTGIYNGTSSVTASGNVSFYKGVNESISGKVELTNMPLSWGSVFLTGIFSDIKGTANGTVDIKGSSQLPDIDGKINLDKAGMKLDFMGTSYDIPTGVVTISNTKIDFGKMTIYDKDKNTASLSGYFSHDHFKNMEMQLRLSSEQCRILDLQEGENELFYGNIVASLKNVSIRGPFNNVSISVGDAIPTQKSHLYLPVVSDKGTGAYSFVTFKTYGKAQAIQKKSKTRMNINIESQLNDLIEVTMVLDPATGDAINAKGRGRLSLQIPSGNEMRMYGSYNIEQGDYTFTLKKVFFKRKFILSSGSTISFNGPFSKTQVNVDALYTVRARLYDLLSDAEKQTGFMPPNEVNDAKTAQDVNVILHMRESLSNPSITFNIALPDNRSVGTYAYTKLNRINQDSRQLFDQVGALLLINSFIPPEGLSQRSALAGGISNVSEIFSGTASSQLTNLVNKVLGDKDLAVDLKYVNYNLSDPASGNGNRNELSLGVRKNYFNDRLIVEVGGKSDWGRPASATSSSATHIAGDFRIQYLLNSGGNLRFNLFRTNDYDVTREDYVARSGIGLSWRKPFDNLSEFFHSNAYNLRKEKERKGNDTVNVKSNTNF